MAVGLYDDDVVLLWAINNRILIEIIHLTANRISQIPTHGRTWIITAWVQLLSSLAIALYVDYIEGMTLNLPYTINDTLILWA